MLEKHNLYFINSRGDYRLLVQDICKNEAFTYINKFLEEHNYKSYYTRTWKTSEGVMFDVGSHTEFFLWGGKNDNKSESN